MAFRWATNTSQYPHTLYNTQYNEVHEYTTPAHILKLWLCTLITHAVVMPVHGDCVAENAFMDIPGVSVKVEHVVDSLWEGN